MYRLLKRKRLEYIPSLKWGQLTDAQRNKILKYQNYWQECKRREDRIIRAQNKLDELKKEMKVMMNHLADRTFLISSIEEFLDIKIYLVPIKRNSVVRYYNLSVSLKGNLVPKSFSLGKSENVKEHLLNYFKLQPKVSKQIKRDWISWMKIEIKTPNNKHEERLVYNQLLKLVIKEQDNFKNIEGSINTIFPILK